MNVGFIEARARSTVDNTTVGDFDCYIFHDVDMLPEDDRNLYGCGIRFPRHLGTYIDKYNYT
jgi:N-terminal region of glycosyl transferase group 7